MTTGQTPAESSGMFVPVRRPEEKYAKRVLRPTRAVPAVLTALVLLALGVLTAVEVISALVGRPARLVPYDQMAGWMRSTAWRDGGALTLAGLLALLGLILLLIALLPGRSRLIALRTGDPDLVVAVSRQTLRRVAQSAAAAVPEVRRARARVSGRRVDVTASTDTRESAELTERIRAAVATELSRLSPMHGLGLRVRVRGQRP